MFCAALAAALLSLAGRVAAQPSSAGQQQDGPPAYFQHLPGADDALAEADSPLGTNRYRFVPAAAFVRRSSSDSLVNDGFGCVYSNLVAGWALNADLQMPDGARVMGVRVFYHVPGASGSIRTWFTSYDGAGGFSDLISNATTNTGGYFSEYFPAATPVTIESPYYAYALNARILGSDTQLCGMRVFYSN